MRVESAKTLWLLPLFDLFKCLFNRAVWFVLEFRVASQPLI